MVERNRENQRRTEEVFELLKEAIEPVLSGDKENLDILAETTNPLTGETAVHFFPVPGVLGERGKQVFEKLRQELEDLGHSFLGGPAKMADAYHVERLWYFSTNLSEIFFAKTEVYDYKRGPIAPERITWSIKNLRPKSRFQKAKESVRRALGLEEQFVQA